MSQYNLVRVLPNMPGLFLRLRDIEAILEALKVFEIVDSFVCMSSVQSGPTPADRWRTYLLLCKGSAPTEITMWYRLEEQMSPQERDKRVRVMLKHLNKYSPWDMSELMRGVDPYLLLPPAMQVDDGRLVRTGA